MGRVSGKVAFITGAARGQGRSDAVRLAAEGADIIAGGRGGSIVINSSKEGIKALPTLAHYTAAKHGVIGLARALSLELAEHMIRVNTIAATAVNTPMIHNDAAYSLFMPHIENPTPDDAAAAFGTLNPMPVPWVETEDVSNAVLFFASDESRYITGITLPVDAGASQK